MPPECLTVSRRLRLHTRGPGYVGLHLSHLCPIRIDLYTAVLRASSQLYRVMAATDNRLVLRSPWHPCKCGRVTSLLFITAVLSGLVSCFNILNTHNSHSIALE